jgi:hypothetical protein
MRDIEVAAAGFRCGAGGLAEAAGELEEVAGVAGEGAVVLFSLKMEGHRVSGDG